MAFTSAMIILGALISGYMFGEMVVLVSNLNKDSNAFNELMVITNTAMNNMGIHPKLQFNIMDYLIATHENASNQEQYENFRAIIPPSIVRKMNASIYADIIADTPVFCSDPQATNEILIHINNSFYKPEEVVISQGDESNCLLFLVSGMLEVEIEPICEGEKFTIRKINPKEYFGEIGILFDTPRTASVKVSKYANVGYVQKNLFFGIMNKYPKTLDLLRLTALHAYPRDPNKRYLYKNIIRLPYFKYLSLPVLWKLMYKLKVENYSENDIIYKEGNEMRKIIFLYEGEIQFKMQIYQKELRRANELSSKPSVVSDSSLSFSGKLEGNASSTHIAKRRAHKHKYAVNHVWCTASPGSIIGWKQALFCKKVDVNIECKNRCKIFVLKSEDIEQIAEECRPLKMQLELFKKKYIESIGIGKDILIRTPVLDCYLTDSETTDRSSAINNSVLKIRSTVLSYILRRREAKDRKAVRIKHVVMKLEAVAQAENRKLRDVSRRIEMGELDPDIMDAIPFLKQQDLEDPILRQFAKVTNNIREMHKKIVEESESLGAMSEMLVSEDAVLDEQISLIQKLMRRYKDN